MDREQEKPRYRLINDVVKTLKPRDKPYEVRDIDLKGFLARIQPTGKITFYLSYRNEAGKMSRLKLGGFPTISASSARSKAETKLAEITLGADPAQEKREAKAVAQAVTLREFITGTWSPHYKTHRKAHDQQLKRLLSAFAPLLDTPLVDLTREDFDKHRQHRAVKPLPGWSKPASAATLNRCNATMRPVLEMARRAGLILVNPLADADKAREDKNAAIRPLTDTEETAIVKVFTDRRAARLKEVQDINERRKLEGRRPLPEVPRFLDYMEAMLLTSLDTGIRRGEAFALEWADVDLTAKTLTVQGEGAKSSQSRVIPLSTRAVDVLTAWREQGTGTGLVFPSRIGGGRLKNIDGAWRQLCDDAKITGLRWHDIRHSFGTRLARAGAPITTIKALMGHSSIITTQRYLHATSTDAENAIKLLEKLK